MFSLFPPTLGRYEILDELGKGAMGIVYKARDPRIDRVVVLKTLRREAIQSAEMEREFLERFYREARAAGKLSHPAIVTVHDVDRDEEAGVDFIAMEYVPGASLAAFTGSGLQMPADQVVEDMLQIAEALDHAHAQGVVHRDVKPANIIVRDDGAVKLADFGIARLDASNLTGTGQTLGSPFYMSPEQIRGARVNGKSDQFSLAVVVYQLLAGRRPFDGDKITTVAYKIAHQSPRPVTELRRDLPEGIWEVLERALEKEPSRRYPTCREFIVALRKALDLPESRPSVAPPSTEVDSFSPAEVTAEAAARPEPPAIEAASPAPPRSSAAAIPVSTGTWAVILGGSMLALMAGSLLLAAILLWPRSSPMPTETAAPTESPAAEPAPAPDRDALVRSALDAGRLALSQGRLDDAERHFRVVLALEPSNASAKGQLERIRVERARPKPEPPAPPEPIPTPDTPEPETLQVQSARLVVRFEHHLERGTITIDVDGATALATTFRARRREVGDLRLPKFTRVFVDTEHEYPIEISPGRHEITVAVEASNVSARASRSVRIEEGGRCTLKVSLGQMDKEIEIEGCR